MRKSRLLLLLILILSACSFKSSQFDRAVTIVKSLTNPKVNVTKADPLWQAEIAGRVIEFLPVQMEQGIRFISQQGVEIDYDAKLFSIVAVRGWESLNQDIKIQLADDYPPKADYLLPNVAFSKTHYSTSDSSYKVFCSAYKTDVQTESKSVFSRQCIESQWKWWRYQDKIEVNGANEITRIEAGIFLNSEPLKLYVKQS